MRVSDELLMKTARKYGIQPGSLKAHVFPLLDQGLTRREVRFALRHLADPERPGVLAGTVRRYEGMWRKAQG